VPILRDRIFREHEAETGAHVAVVSEARVRMSWPRQDSIGNTSN